MKLTERETATVLAALRLAQQNELEFGSMIHFSDGMAPLTASEIDDLCERINTDTDPTVIAMQWSYEPVAGYQYFLCNPPINSDELHAAASEKGFRLVLISQHIPKDVVRKTLDLDDSVNLP